MSGELDEKGLEAAKAAATKSWESEDMSWSSALAAGIRAYLAASPSPSMEMEVVAWRVPDEWSPTGYVFATESLIDGSVPLVTVVSAQSALAAMRAERIEAERDALSFAGKLNTAEAQVQRLTEENEALRKALAEIECAETTNDYGQPMSYAGAYYRSLASQALKENAL